jgi:hypothetical protein
MPIMLYGPDDRRQGCDRPPKLVRRGQYSRFHDELAGSWLRPDFGGISASRGRTQPKATFDVAPERRGGGAATYFAPT